MSDVKLKVTAKRAKELILWGIIDLIKIDLHSIRDVPAHFLLGSDADGLQIVEEMMAEIGRQVWIAAASGVGFVVG